MIRAMTPHQYGNHREADSPKEIRARFTVRGRKVYEVIAVSLEVRRQRARINARAYADRLEREAER